MLLSSYNLLQTLPMNTFEGTFEPTSDDRRVIFACGWWLNFFIYDMYNIFNNIQRTPGSVTASWSGSDRCSATIWTLTSTNLAVLPRANSL